MAQPKLSYAAAMALLAAPYTRKLVHQMYELAITKDPVDALNDARLLVAILEARADKILAEECDSLDATAAHLVPVSVVVTSARVEGSRA